MNRKFLRCEQKVLIALMVPTRSLVGFVWVDNAIICYDKKSSFYKGILKLKRRGYLMKFYNLNQETNYYILTKKGEELISHIKDNTEFNRHGTPLKIHLKGFNYVHI